MLTKITRCDDVESLPLACDPALIPAQIAAALKLPPDDSRVEAARAQLERDGRAEPTAVDVASVVAGAVVADYWTSSDVTALLDVPDDVVRAHIRAPSPDQMREAERAAGPPPRRGERVWSRVTAKAGTMARFAEMEHSAVKAVALAKGETPPEPQTFGEIRDDLADDLDERDRRAMHEFELWTGARDQALVSLALDRVVVMTDAGVRDLDPLVVRGSDGFDINLLVGHVAEHAAMIAEVAKHVRNLTRLGKAGRRS